MKLRVRVSQQNIDNGIKQDGERCPIHRALEDKLQYAIFLVDGTEVSFPALDVSPILLPERAQEFIDSFDVGRKVFPFEFNLELQPEHERFVRIQEQDANDSDPVLCST